MDYLERNIKDSYNQKTVLTTASNIQGSTIIFWMLLVFWSLAVTFWKFAS